MKNKNLLFLFLFILLTFGLTACTSNDPQKSGKSVLNIEPKIVKDYSSEEKRKILSDLSEAAKKEQYEIFGNILAQIYERGLQGKEEFTKVERDLYVKGTEYFEQGLTDQAYKMADTIYAKVFESWRFKYLKIRCLERYGQEALAKKDYAKAKDYARQILSIEYRPEGANLTAKIALQEAQEALQKKDKPAAKTALMATADMEIDPALRQQIDEMMKSIGN